jgi:phosphinothricin acetyltransferase
MTVKIEIRLANEKDVPGITDIYNEAILTTTATFDTELLSLEDRYEWFNNRTSDLPVVVAEVSGRIVGYAALNRWSDRRAYDISAELSLYIVSQNRGLGIGKALNSYILEIAKSTNLYTLILRITSDNEASLKLARCSGFSDVGVLRRCGKKFDRVLDVVYMQKILK